MKPDEGTTQLREALQELVTLKDMKDRADSAIDHDRVSGVDMVDYYGRKPLAWEAARKALSDKQAGAGWDEAIEAAAKVAITGPQTIPIDKNFEWVEQKPHSKRVIAAYAYRDGENEMAQYLFGAIRALKPPEALATGTASATKLQFHNGSYTTPSLLFKPRQPEQRTGEMQPGEPYTFVNKRISPDRRKL